MMKKVSIEIACSLFNISSLFVAMCLLSVVDWPFPFPFFMALSGFF